MNTLLSTFEFRVQRHDTVAILLDPTDVFLLLFLIVLLYAVAKSNAPAQSLNLLPKNCKMTIKPNATAQMAA